jgi:cobalt-zinc-cadmium efflux system protein
MDQDDHHHHSRHDHRHHHHHTHGTGDRRVLGAIIVNLGLTVVQIAGGLVAGSLALVADALHNLSDAVSLILAYAARRIARRPSDKSMTFGYARAEVVAALINYTTLIIIGLYLVYEAILRFFEPEPVAGWIVVAIAAVALLVDLATAALTYALSKESMNLRAAFLHNVADALGSVGVIVAGTLVILEGWWVVDPLVTLLIAAYILWQAFAEIMAAIRVLMLGAPLGMDFDGLIGAIREIEGVRDVHHVHVFAIDERINAFEAHIVIGDDRASNTHVVKGTIKSMIRERFGIHHATLEFETNSQACEGEDARLIGRS